MRLSELGSPLSPLVEGVRVVCVWQRRAARPRLVHTLGPVLVSQGS